jgi:hypothetical protein
MSEQIPPWFRAKYPAERIERLQNAPEGFGFALYKILTRHGKHIFDIGSTDSGKSQKKFYFNWWLCQLETIIEFDSGKPGDIEPYFDSPDEKTKFNKPIQILIPWGMSFSLKGKIPPDLVYKVTPMMSPEQYFTSIEPGWINIISVRNYFDNDSEMKQYLIRMFKGFELQARLGQLSYFCPAEIVFEEAHIMMGGSRVNKDSESVLLSDYLSKWQREMRAYGIRNFIISQSYKDVPPAVRENTAVLIVNRSTNLKDESDGSLKYLATYARRAEPWEGWFVINGVIFYSNNPIPFPHFKMPNLSVVYKGIVGQEEKLEEEMFTTDGGWQAASHAQPTEAPEPAAAYTRWDYAPMEES